MSPAAIRFLHRTLAGLAIAAGLVASGCASDRSSLESSPHRRPDISNVVQRPTYEVEGTKPLYLSGYAGANYRPAAQAER
jgi:hypothetical protein